MTHDEVRLFLDGDAGLRLLRSGNAPLVVSFLYTEFKQQPRAAIRHDELQERLENTLIELRRRDTEAYPATAQSYLSTWCDEHHRYLRKYFESGTDEPVYDLTRLRLEQERIPHAYILDRLSAVHIVRND